ncbi:hypothetical protein SAMN05421504_101500 [Amycolatopsis xylanica]|uniref:Extracellular solute-binding protein n=1 Tax=Amycolatopsis xylanica TaxID=589385 RepID=A0A1H2T9Y2_9PSEU|nr:hypothetical protein [Amycolatopsis xylanica]SDW40702.1 hypothetical protein SAMN05421504_101500 [Amycolatopsis xylanica]
MSEVRHDHDRVYEGKPVPGRARRGRIHPVVVIVVLVVTICGVFVGVRVFSGSGEPPVTVVRALLASKREFFEDAEVKRLLLAKGFRVEVTPAGSFDIVRSEDIDSYHFVFPSGQSAADLIRDRRARRHAVPFRPFFSPIVLGTFREYADALVKAGAATKQNDLYYTLELDKLVDLMDHGKTWSDYQVDNRNRLLAQIPDPCRTYSGSIYVALLSFAKHSGKTPVDEAEALGWASEIKPLFDAEGQHGEDLSPKYLAPEGRSFAPVVVIYEHQFIAHQVRTHDRTGRPDAERVLLYPSAQHETAPELISFTPEGDQIGRLLMEDPGLRRRAVELGFHVLGVGEDVQSPEFSSMLTGRGLPVPRNGVGDTETWLPKPALFEKMITAIAGCR